MLATAQTALTPKYATDDNEDSHDELLARADVQEAISRLEDLISGRVKGLTEDEFQAALYERILSRRVS